MALPECMQGNMSLPLIGSPLFIISGPELVIAQCKTGITGAFPSLNARPIEQLDEWLTQINTELDTYKKENPDKKVAPYAVNLIVHHSNSRLEEDIELCVKHKVPVVITSLNAPTVAIERIHSYGGVILHDVTNIKHAKKAAGEGVDGLILVCTGAGGHAGTLSPFALVPEVREWFDGTIILSGAMGNGDSILSAQAIGADLAYMGTRFIATEEARAQQEYKQMLVDSSAKDILYSNLFTGVHGNYLAPSVVAAGLDPNDLPVADKSKMNFGSGGNTGAKAWKDIWGSGQGIGGIEKIETVAEVVDGLKSQYEAARERMLGGVKYPQ
jgi:nitronate monooxygenase